MSFNILVVDDTNFMRKMVTDCLKQAGHNVVGEAINGREAIRMYEELRPQIVMMDLTMPEMNGIDALKEILKIDPEAVVLICSASNQQDMIFDALDVGAKGYLMKPFNPERVTEIIRKYAEPHLLKQDSTQPKPIEDLLDDLPDSKPDIVQEADKSEKLDPIGDLEEEETLQLHPFELRTTVEEEPVELVEPATGLEQEKPEAVEQAVTKVHQAPAAIPSILHTKPINPTGGIRPMRNFVSSLLCNWQEEIQGEVKQYNVVCTESENHILIEMAGAGNEKQTIQFTIDGFRDLAIWFEQQLGSRSA